MSLPQIPRSANRYPTGPGSRRRGWLQAWWLAWDEGWVAGDIARREELAPQQALIGPALE